jgi:hypothetical protein
MLNAIDHHKHAFRGIILKGIIKKYSADWIYVYLFIQGSLAGCRFYVTLWISQLDERLLTFQEALHGLAPDCVIIFVSAIKELKVPWYVIVKNVFCNSI